MKQGFNGILLLVTTTTTVFVLVLLSSNGVSGLNCYECVYDEGAHTPNKDCLDKPKESDSKACGVKQTTEPWACLKTSQTKPDGKQLISRSCSALSEDYEAKCYSQAEALKDLKKSPPAGGATDVTVCYCRDSDNCNAGSKVTLNLIGLVLLAIGAIAVVNH